MFSSVDIQSYIFLNFCHAMLCYKRGLMSLYVCRSFVRLSVSHVRVFCWNEKTYSKFFFIVYRPTILVFHTKPYDTIPTGTPSLRQKSRFSTNIWLWDRWLLESRARNKVIALSGGVCLSRQTDDEVPHISEFCLWQQACASFLAVDGGRTEQNRI